jgi:hypothetical protein
LVAGRASKGDPSVAEKVADLRDDLEPAEQGIELTATEYAQAVRAGRVVAPTEYSAARQDVRRAVDTVAHHRADLRALSPPPAIALDRALSALSAAVERRADPAEVRRLSEAARAALAAATGRS